MTLNATLIAATYPSYAFDHYATAMDTPSTWISTQQVESAARSFFSSPLARSLFDNCLSKVCPRLSERDMEKREQQAIEAVGTTGFINRLKQMFGVSNFEEAQELLRLNKNDPRDKLLYFSFAQDHNDALNPHKSYDTLQRLNEKYDLKFKYISDPAEICHEVHDAALTGRLMNIIADGHGHGNGMVIQREIDFIKKIKKPILDFSADVLKTFFPTCFNPLHPAGKIILFSCCTAAPGTPDKLCWPTVKENPDFGYPKNVPVDPDYVPFAQELANLTNRTVVGANTLTTGRGTKIASLDPLMVRHDQYKKGIPVYYKVFKPQHPQCQNDLDLNKLHPRERQAIQALKADHISKSLLLPSATEQDLQEYLELCQADARKKMLYLTAKDDLNGALHPQYNIDVISTFADKLDLKYKVVGSFDAVCQAVHDAADKGKVDVLVIDAHGRPEYGMLLEKDTEKGRLVGNQDFAKCFADMKANGRIVLLGGASGAPRGNDPKDNLAQKMADSAKRMVIAPTDLVRCQLSVSSFDPVHLKHPAKDQPDKNIFQTFTPRFSECSSLTSDQIHSREQKAVDLIQQVLSSKNIAPQNPLDSLTVCKDDPRPKVLYLCAEYDSNGFLDPQYSAPFLGSIAEDCDLQFKIVQSQEDIGKAIEEASLAGQIGAIFILGHGDYESIVLSNNLENRLIDLPCDSEKKSNHQDWETIFAKLPPSSPIFLISTSIGQSKDNDPKHTFSQRLANQTNRVVYGSTNPANAGLLRLTSSDPIRVFLPTPDNPRSNILKRFDPIAPPVLPVKIPVQALVASPVEAPVAPIANNTVSAPSFLDRILSWITGSN